LTPEKRSPQTIGFYVLILIIIISTLYLLNMQNTALTIEVEYSEMKRLFLDEQVEYFVVEDGNVKMSLREEYDGADLVTHKLYNINIFYSDLGELIDSQLESGVLTDYNYALGWQAPWWFSFIPYLIIFVVFILIWYFLINRSGVGGDKGAMKFSKARTRLAAENKKKVTFADVAGADEEKAELQEIVDFLKHPAKYIALGARIPKGVLLIGPPGTGKTLIAKAVAGEAGVQFLSISGSDFVELYVGVGASRVRDLFEQAKKIAPSIIFIDEIDAVGRQRGAGLGGGHDEREQTLNQLLVEMDGFGTNEGVIVLAATNRSDILDNALLRPGRFDRQVYVGLPDIRGREAILKVHAKGKMLADDVDLGSIAKGTPGFTGADLENLLNEAALLAARRNNRFITMRDLDDAALKVVAGPEKRSRVVTEKERKLTAYHEAGHAVVSHFLEHVDPVHHISIIPHGMAGGMTVFRPQEDKNFNSRTEIFQRIVSSLGGRMAEKLMLGDISTGASADIQQATALARSMVTKYGMSEKLGPISFDDSSHSVFIGRDFSQTKTYSEKTAAIIDDEVKNIFNEAMAKCEEILLKYKDILVATANYLLEHETLSGTDFAYICENNGAYPPKTDKKDEAYFIARNRPPESPRDAASEDGAIENPDSNDPPEDSTKENTDSSDTPEDSTKENADSSDPPEDSTKEPDEKSEE
jgi:cell division protease FtsH